MEWHITEKNSNNGIESSSNASRDREVEAATSGSLIRSVNQVFDKLKTHISPLPSCNKEKASKDR